MYGGANVERATNPKDRAGLFSLIFFWFTLPIFKISSKRELEEYDVYKPTRSCKSKELGDLLEKEWIKECKKKNVSLTKTLLRIFGKRYMWYGFLNLICKVTLMTIKPIATGKLVSFFSPSSELTLYDACYYAALVVGSSSIRYVFAQYYHLALSELGLQIKIAICSLIYRKSLKLTSASLIKTSNGKIVTLMSKDVQVFETVLMHPHDLWVGIVQGAIMTYIMYKQIKNAALIGVIILLTTIPMQICFAAKAMRVRLSMQAKSDARLRRIQEILTSIKLIKLYTWEKYYTKITNEIRKLEMKKLRSIFYLKVIITSVPYLSERVSFYFCILGYFYMYGTPLSTESTFVLITCYSSLKYLFAVSIPWSVAQFAEAKAALKRIKQFLLIEDIHEKNKNEDSIRKNAESILVKNATVEFLGKKILDEINFSTNISLIGITGGVGSGKSTFLKMLMEDVGLENGNLNVEGEISYSSQEPWLFPSTIKENILFGLPYNEKRYKEIVKVCGLTRDLENFPLKDNTIVNDKGLNLSKGQQARINLARAIYKQSDIYLLDDIMCALDANVGKFVFEECIKGFLKNKLVILVCHNKKFLQETERILVFKNGKITADGTFNELENEGVDFGTTPSLDEQIDRVKEGNKIPNQDENADENVELLISDNVEESVGIYGEEKASGKVGFDVYKKYFYHAGGWKLIPILLVLFFSSQLCATYFDYYIKNWLKAGQMLSESMKELDEANDTLIKTNLSATVAEFQEKYEATMDTYSILIVLVVTTSIIRLFAYFGLVSRASTRLHHAVFSKITGACMTFFDRHLSGNILNRFSKDMDMVDEGLPYALLECIKAAFMMVFVAGVILYINPILIVPTIIIVILMYFARKYYLITSRSLRRLGGTTRAPVIGYLNTSLEGLTTIRACGTQQILKDQFDGHQDLHGSAIFMYMSASRAFALYLELLCLTYLSAIIISFLIMHETSIVNSEDVGIAVTQAFGLTGLLQWGIRQWTEVENYMTSVERIVEYENAEQEEQEGINPHNWPTKGLVQYKNVHLKYTNSDKIVLRDVNFIIKPKEKVGIIGRTGAGKSSIISVLFRLYHIDGSIIIDNHDIKDIKIGIVRKKIALIPQDPVLFEGTLRTNLDPYGDHTDQALWNVLDEVNLKSFIGKTSGTLECVINGGGANFSIGQRQLICLARAILRKNKILVLDEATANVDPQTDALIQATIKKLFSDCTILTIAHRLNTIINSDKIMVVDFGSVVEFDDPKILLNKRTGIFYSMAKQAGLIN